MDEHLSTAEAVRYLADRGLKVSATTLRSWLKKGRLPRAITARDLDRLLLGESVTDDNEREGA